MKEAKIVVDDKVVASIKCGEDGIHIKKTEEGKTMCKEMFEGGKGCC